MSIMPQKYGKYGKRATKSPIFFWYVKKLYYLCTRKQQPMAG
jgi:hypothetical protein